jgi:hypothetical protein
VLPDTLAICWLPADDPVPTWAGNPGPFLTISRTAEELSITAAQRIFAISTYDTDYVLVKERDLTVP